MADQTRCAGLIGSILQDLAPLKFEFPDARYHGLLDAVTAIFDRQRCQAVPLAERIAAADALGQAGDARLDLRRDDYWVAISAGKFLMGAQSQHPKGANYDPEAIETGVIRETPHEVSLDAYCIARYPVTVGQYGQFVEDEGYEDDCWWAAGGFGEYTEPDGWERQLAYPSRPVVGVSWWEAMAFCIWARVRLATEAEWERAARGTTGRKYPWGYDPVDEQRANYSSGPDHATPVGIYPLGSTPEGICDLAGNVWEWCEDGFAEYTAESASNPRGDSGGSLRVNRGGSWRYVAVLCRAACHCGLGPSCRSGRRSGPSGPVPHVVRHLRGRVRTAVVTGVPRVSERRVHVSAAKPQRIRKSGRSFAGVEPRLEIGLRADVEHGLGQFLERIEGQISDFLLDFFGQRPAYTAELRQQNTCDPASYCDAFYRCDVGHVQTLLQIGQFLFESTAQILPQAHHPVDEAEDLAYLICIIPEIVQVAYQLPFGSVSPLRVAGGAQCLDLGPRDLDGQ